MFVTSFILFNVKYEKVSILYKLYVDEVGTGEAGDVESRVSHVSTDASVTDHVTSKSKRTSGGCDLVESVNVASVKA